MKLRVLQYFLAVAREENISHVPRLQKPCVCRWYSAPLLLTLCCSCVNLLKLFLHIKRTKSFKAIAFRI